MPCYSFDGLVPVVDPTAYVHPTAVLTGDVVVGPGCYVGPCASLRGDFGRIVLQAGANVQDCCVLHSFPGAQVLVEADGHIGHGAVLHGCIVRRDAMVGMKAVVMDGAEIGEQAMVAACAFVAGGTLVPARALVTGTPAQVKRQLTEEEVQRKQRGTQLYQQLAQRALATSRETQPLAKPEAGRG
jgi:phenylacetic acid degradation protein